LLANVEIYFFSFIEKFAQSFMVSCFSQGVHVCLVTLLARIFKDCGQKTVQLPFLGEVLIISVGTVPFCVVFAILWAVYRHAPFAWIGQDILGICLMITVLQMARLPNIRVASALLSAAFVYDIFWVFISPLIFHESVMIAVSVLMTWGRLDLFNHCSKTNVSLQCLYSFILKFDYQ